MKLVELVLVFVRHSEALSHGIFELISALCTKSTLRKARTFVTARAEVDVIDMTQ